MAMKGLVPRLALLVLLLASMPALTAPVTPPVPTPLLLTGARVLDPAGDRLLEGRDVLIENGRIAAVGPTGTLPVPAETRKVDPLGADADSRPDRDAFASPPAPL